MALNASPSLRMVFVVTIITKFLLKFYLEVGMRRIISAGIMN